MRSVLRPFPAILTAAVLTATVLLTACGPQKSDGSGGGTARAQAPGPSGSSCGHRGSGTATPSPSAPEKDGVRITAVGRGARRCAEFEVTNHETQPLTYTITFAFQSDSGAALENTTETVPSVKPGQTVRRTLSANGPYPGAPGG
ncbi:hypothetical protein AB0K09_33270, partial [Streptomyces sp. NPDC049577]